MSRKLSVVTIILAMMIWAISLPVFAAGPDFFTPAIYADGIAWATKGLGPLPAPNDHNNQSFDKLFVFTNGAEGQLPVAEAAPGNPEYNGGRWNAHMATWFVMGDPPLVKSYAELEGYVVDGFLMITPADNYFECPLLPFKE